MYIQATDAHAIASFRRFYSLLPRGSDLSLLILNQVICLAEAISSEQIHENIWEAARKLHSLRNHIAHCLELTGVNEKMNHISKLLGVPRGRLTSKP